MLPLALIAMAMGTLLVVPFLGQAGTALLGSRSYGQALVNRYSSDAGVEHAIWRLKYEPGFASSLTPQNPTAGYSITVNNMSVDTTVTWTVVESPPEPPPPPEGSQADRIQVTKGVSPELVPAGQATTFTYTISIKNVSTSTVHLQEVKDLLPAGFSYRPGTSSGVTSAEPDVELEDGQQELEWFFDSPTPAVAAGETVIQVFQATATPGQAIYWNEAQVTLGPNSVGIVGTGSTAPVGGGGLTPFGYEISSSAGGSAIRARIRITDTGVSILSWQFE